MSVWTHVAAVVRIDSMQSGTDWTNWFGRECLWDAPPEVWAEKAENPEAFLPSGSEGTLHMTVWENPHANHLAHYTVTIFGDLRDSDDEYWLLGWFMEKVKELWIRQAMILIECEGHPRIRWTYPCGTEELE